MDKHNAKRSRSSSPTGNKSGGEPKKKKGSKKKDKNKRIKESSADTTPHEKEKHKHHHHHHHHKDTATADGRIMAQMLSTFSNLEHSRFQAYKRSSLPADSVEKWVAACLNERYTRKNERSITTTHTPSLKDLVAPGQAQEIALVVGIAGKVYAQRLVAEAVRIQSNSNEPLQAEAVWKAVISQRRSGADPGFFMQSSNLLNWHNNAASASTSHYEIRRLAAEHAQEEYDKLQQAADDQKNDAMEIDKDELSSSAARKEGGDEDSSKEKPESNTKTNLESPMAGDIQENDDSAMEIDESKAGTEAAHETKKMS